MTRIRNIKIYLFVLIGVICVHPRLTSGQAPEILKVDPPSWWVGSTMNPVRVMIRGRNLAGARVQAGPGLRVVGSPKISESGTYIFVDVYVASAGKRSLTVTTPNGSANAPFEVLGPLD